MRKNLFTALLSFIIISLIPLTISASDISPIDDMFSGGPDSSYVVIRKTGTMFSVPTKSYALVAAAVAVEKSPEYLLVSISTLCFW